MELRKALGLAVIILLALAFNANAQFPYVTGVDRHTPAYPPPTKYTRGVATPDAIFHTNVVRLTDPTDTPTTNFHILRYAKWSPENCNGTRALLRTRSGTNKQLYNVDKTSAYCYTTKDNSGVQLRAVDFPEGSGQFEPRWDHTDPNKLYYPYGTAFYSYNILTGASTLIRDFANDYPEWTTGGYNCQVLCDDEGRPSTDSRYWAFFLRRWEPIGDANGQYIKKIVFCYDKQTNTILGTLDNATFVARHGGANWVTMSPSGTYVVIGSDYGTWNTSRYDKTFANGLSLKTWANHSDVAIDTDGNEVLFGYDLVYSDAESMVRLSDAKPSLLLKRYWPTTNDYSDGSYGHASGNHASAKPGWGLFSSYRSVQIVPGTKWDSVLIFLMQLKDRGAAADWANTNTIPTGHLPYVWQVAHHYNQGGCWEAHATMNDAGTRIYFSSPWIYNGDTESCPSYGGTDKHDVYIVELPSTWWTDLGGLSSFVAQPLHPPSPPTGLKIIK